MKKNKKKNINFLFVDGVRGVGKVQRKLENIKSFVDTYCTSDIMNFKSCIELISEGFANEKRKENN